MNMHRFSENILAKNSLAPQVAGGVGTTNGASVDTQGFRNAALEAVFGAMTGAAPAGLIKIQESNDAGNTDPWADASTTVANSGGTQTTTNASQTGAQAGGVYLVNIDLQKRKRYLRAVCVVSGTVTAVPFSANILLINGQWLPPIQDNAAVSV